MINKNSMNIAKFSFINAIKSKGFIIYNIILLVSIVIATNFTTVKTIFKQNNIFKGTVYNVEILDNDEYIYPELKDNLNVEKVDKVNRIYEDIEYNEDNIEKDKIVVKVLENEDNEKYLEIISKETLDGDIYSAITSTLKEKRNDEIEAKYGISETDIAKYNSDVYVERKIIDTDSVIKGDYYIVKTVMIMVIYGLIVFGTSAVASQIANEKTSKSAEYIFTSVSAKDYLNGKVLGANLKTVANMAFMVLYLAFGMLLNTVLNSKFGINVQTSVTTETAAMSGMLFGIDIKVIKYIILSFVYILLTSTLLSYIQAGMTAKVKSINEMDNSQSITLTLIIIAYVVAVATSELNNIFTKIIANVPIFSMFAMPTNYLNGVVGMWQILLSMFILVVAIIISMNIVSKKFKQDILDLGPRKEEKHDEKLEIIDEEVNKVKRANIKKYITGVAISLLAVILIQSVLGVAITFLMPNATLNQNVIAVSCVFILSFLIPIMILKGYIDMPKTKKYVKKSSSKKGQIVSYTLMGIAAMYVIGFIVELILEKIKVNPTMIENALYFDNSYLGYILFFIEIAILPAIFEELLFRKVMINGAKKYGTVFSIIFTAVMFGLIHMNIPQAINAVFIGIVFAYVVIKTGSIIPSMILHFVNNGTQALLMINENNVVMTNIISYVYVALAIIGALIFVLKVIKNRKEFKIENKTKTEVSVKDIISNYYMIVVLLFFVVMSMM